MPGTWVFRKERALTSISMEAPVLGGLVLRNWKVAKGDSILLIAGSGLETRFLATARVASVNISEASPAELRRFYPRTPHAKARRFDLGTIGWTWLEPTRTLGQMMYSLERVSNFSRPYLHFRHQGTVSDVDVKAIQDLSIDGGRSLYFGLLQYLPGRQREQLDLMCRQALALNQPVFDPTIAASVLLAILDERIGVADDLARKIGLDRAKLEFSRPLVGAADGAEDWKVDPLIRHSLKDEGAMQELLSEIAEAGQNVSTDRRREWRTHRW